MRTNVRGPGPTTHEGAPAVPTTPLVQLRRTILTCMLWEDNFYESGQSVADRIRDLVKQVPAIDAAQVALDARTRMKLRHAPLLIARWMLEHQNGRRTGDLIAELVQRPDEAGELVSLYRATGGKGMPKQLRFGLRRALKHFNEYQLAKHDHSSASWSIADVLRLSHVRADSVEQGSLFARLLNKERIPETTKSSRFPVRAAYGLPEANPGLKTPETWESELSSGMDKRTTFERLIAERKLGALALLRNLRGMLDAGVKEDLLRDALARMDTTRVLPMRFITAAKHAPRLEDALERALQSCTAALPQFKGKTAVLVDVSGSMRSPVSAKSELQRTDAAIALAMLLRWLCQEVRIFAFGTYMQQVPPRTGFGLRDAIRACEGACGGGTNLGSAVMKAVQAYTDLDRMIVITDEQSHDAVPTLIGGHAYLLNVAPYRNGVGFGSWTTISGWSESVLDFIRELEAL